MTRLSASVLCAIVYSWRISCGADSSRLCSRPRTAACRSSRIAACRIAFFRFLVSITLPLWCSRLLSSACLFSWFLQRQLLHNKWRYLQTEKFKKIRQVYIVEVLLYSCVIKHLTNWYGCLLSILLMSYGCHNFFIKNIRIGEQTCQLLKKTS